MTVGTRIGVPTLTEGISAKWNYCIRAKSFATP